MTLRVKEIDFGSAEIEYPKGYRGQVLHMSDSCVLIATLVPAGAAGPPSHKHVDGDQTYFVIEGTISITLGATQRTLGPGSAVLIPQGLPHHNWNDSDTDEIHLEVITPGVRIRRPLSVPAPLEEVGGLVPAIASVDDTALERTGRSELTGPRQGSAHTALDVEARPPGTRPTALQLMPVDRYYLALDGPLGIDVGIDSHVIEPLQLAIVPAGLAHQCWNPADAVNRYLTVTVFGQTGDPADYHDSTLVSVAVAQHDLVGDDRVDDLEHG
ncbi:MAG: cupin domain-containing protein [Nocardioidaceae bacterium]